MSSLQNISAVGLAIVDYLKATYPAELQQKVASHINIDVISSGQLNADKADFTIGITLYLFRATLNEHLRNSGRPATPSAPVKPLAVDLHYLFTIWATEPAHEHLLLAWLLRQLQERPLLTETDMVPFGAASGTGDVVQLVPSEISVEDMMRIWDALDPFYRLSISFVARVVRIDPDPAEVGQNVVAKRFQLTGDRSTKARP